MPRWHGSWIREAKKHKRARTYSYVIFKRSIDMLVWRGCGQHSPVHTTHFNLYFSLFTHIPLANKIITTANYLVVILCADIRFSYRIFHFSCPYLCIRAAFCQFFAFFFSIRFAWTIPIVFQSILHVYRCAYWRLVSNECAHTAGHNIRNAAAAAAAVAAVVWLA